MRAEDMILISVDDHIIEPPHLWQSRVPAKYKDAAPKIVDDGRDEYWYVEGRQLGNLGLSAVAGKPKAKRVIYLFQSGAPSQLDLFDYKPTLRRFAGQDLPASVRSVRASRPACACAASSTTASES